MKGRALVVVIVGAALLAIAPMASAQTDLDCDDFETQAEAQAVYDQDPNDPNRLDGDDDGVACEALSESDGSRLPRTAADTRGLQILGSALMLAGMATRLVRKPAKHRMR